MATLNAMFKLFDGYSTTVDKINRKTDEATNKILKASGSTDSFNKKLEATGASANTASGGLGKFISAAVLIAGALKGMSIADEFTNTSARLSIINDGLQTQAELQEKIFDAAYRSKGAYSDMASAISKMGILAGDQFKSNDELIAFTELLQKSFKVGGASTSEQSSAMLQLSQAMAAGKLQGDEFRSIMENAPMLAQAIATYTGKSKGDLKQMSSDGTITGDIIKNALFMAGDDINNKFATMPMTFADIWNRIKNGGLEALKPVMDSINRLINTDGFQSFVSIVISGINGVASGLTWLINMVTAFWGIIGPILGAIGGYLLAGIITKLWLMIAPLVTQAGLWALITSPIFLVVLAIGLVVAALNYMGVSTETILGVVMGTFWGVCSFIFNIIATLVNLFISFSDFIGNLFIDPIAAIKGLFYDMAITILGYISSLASSLKELVNLIPGIKMNTASGFEGVLDKLKQDRNNLSIESGIKNSTKWQTNTAGDMFNTGYNTGSNLSFGGGFNSGSNKGFDIGSLGPIAVEGTGKNKAVDVSMEDSDLQYIRDMAERDYINKFSTATLAPNINVSFGDIHETADANKVKGILEKLLSEEIAVVAEG